MSESDMGSAPGPAHQAGAADPLRSVGVCVLNWNTRVSLLRCIGQLIEKAGLAPVQIVVVDNASEDGSAAAIRRHFPSVTLLASSENLGYSRGNNLGAAYLVERGYPHLLFLNPDVVLERDALIQMLDVLTADPSTGCVGGVPVRPGGRARRAARNRPGLIEKLVLYGPLARICGAPFADRHILRASEIRNGQTVYAIYGAACLFRTEAFVVAGGFDEEFFLFEEEFVMAERLGAHGWRVAACLATYLHEEAAGTRQIPFRRRVWLLRSEFRLLRKYWRRSLPLCLAVAAFRVVELLAFCWYYAARAAVAAWSGRALRPNRTAMGSVSDAGPDCS
jgi:GT2 family glycosyltransferase